MEQGEIRRGHILGLTARKAHYCVRLEMYGDLLLPLSVPGAYRTAGDQGQWTVVLGGTVSTSSLLYSGYLCA